MKRSMIAPLCGLSLVALCAAAETTAQTKSGEAAKPATVAGNAPPEADEATPPASLRTHAHRASAAEASVALANRAATFSRSPGPPTPRRSILRRRHTLPGYGAGASPISLCSREVGLGRLAGDTVLGDWRHHQQRCG